MNPPRPLSRLDELPAALALEVDALCDDFERHWRRSRRRGTAPPEVEAFLTRASEAVRPALVACLRELERELAAGLALPEVPGLVLEEEIGRGGMGVVYRARRTADGRAVALKLIPGAEHARWSRWLAELADLRHPNLVPLEAFGSHAGLHFVVMPLVQGGDLKPSNILLASAHEREPLVCDFGLAGRLTEAESAGVMGTPPYMAPEQTEGRPLTAAADVWGLGAVLYELLTGRPPFVDSDGRLDADRKRAGDPAPPRDRNPAVDDTLQRICLRCLEREEAARYPTAAALADDLHWYLNATAPT